MWSINKVYLGNGIKMSKNLDNFFGTALSPDSYYVKYCSKLAQYQKIDCISGQFFKLP
jgi:hypothetical protein